MSLSASTRRALQKVDDTSGLLVLLKMDHPSLSAPIRLVNDTRPITTLGDTFLGIPFAITLPNDKAKEAPRARLQIDNVGREITSELEGLPPGASLMATVLIVHRSTPSVVDYQFTSPLSGVVTDLTTVSAVLGADELMRRSVVLLRFDPATAPGVFPD